jgi:hypothetical protein
MTAHLTYKLGEQVYPVVVDLQPCYANGRQAIVLNTADGEPFMTASVNLPLQPCPEGEVWIKNWSENEGILSWLIRHAIVGHEVLATCRSGFVEVTRHRLLPQKGNLK